MKTWSKFEDVGPTFSNMRVLLEGKCTKNNDLLCSHLRESEFIPLGFLLRSVSRLSFLSLSAPLKIEHNLHKNLDTAPFKPCV